jgi:hypothetical protein
MSGRSRQTAVEGVQDHMERRPCLTLLANHHEPAAIRRDVVERLMKTSLIGARKQRMRFPDPR